MARGQPRTLKLMPPEVLPQFYADEVFRSADLYRRKTGIYPMNPRQFVPTGIDDIDQEFITQYELWREWVQYFYDFADRDPSLR